MTQIKVGVALGGGGAKGLAHVPMLAVFDELGIEVSAISGSSIGAVIGALYAAGIPAREICNGIKELNPEESEWMLGRMLPRSMVGGWLDLVGMDFGGKGLVRADKSLEALADAIKVSTFEELEVSLRVVAADFWTREQVVFDTGPLIPAVSASMALPGLLKPVEIGDRVLVDGGTVNPLPYDLLADDCDVVVAIDVMGKRARDDEEDRVPSPAEAIFNAYQIMQRSILREKMRQNPPTIYIEPDIVDIRVLDFLKAEEIFDQAQPSREELIAALRHHVPV
jgi:NTE family protein